MQAILTKLLPATNTKQTRVKATCARGSLIVSYPHELSGDEIHRYAAERLVQKFLADDQKTYGTKPSQNPWRTRRVLGTLPSGDVCHVFTS